ncbi:hypothetical protein BpHYR1_051513 [Brachionus plicatilis]|uniref:Uncharacterized protein n=1 Tax=Brachionus plicatilis TaxID=10195 RepID=A0A3M7R8L3_BRAPC|nr:hypothetical protein BpHYR1_051513 [Brachionus plicatilis]
MCIVHEPSLHYLFQDLLVSFQQSKTLSLLFLRRVGSLLCTCQKELLYDSKNIIETQRSLFKWFDEKSKNSEQLSHFKSVIDVLKSNGSIDSGTKITLLTLLKDTDELNFSKLRAICSKKSLRKNVFFVKLVRLKFDLKLCSVKEFVDLLNKIDNSAIKYIKLTTKSKIIFRDMDHLTVRNFMGELEVTLESRYEKNLKNSEFYLKRLADAVHYRLAQKIPSSDTMIGNGSLNNLRVLLQSSPDSSLNDNDSFLSKTDIELSCSELSVDNGDSSKIGLDTSKNSSASESFTSQNQKLKQKNQQKHFKSEKTTEKCNEFEKIVIKLSSSDKRRNESGNLNLARILVNSK